jgi:hypothetical protein
MCPKFFFGHGAQIEEKKGMNWVVVIVLFRFPFFGAFIIGVVFLLLLVSTNYVAYEF